MYLEFMRVPEARVVAFRVPNLSFTYPVKRQPATYPVAFLTASVQCHAWGACRENRSLLHTLCDRVRTDCVPKAL